MLGSMADSKTSLKRKLSGSTDTGPKVSIVMPVYNAAPFIEASIESVIAQTYRPLELSIFVDASEDGTLEILVDLVPRLEARGVDVLISSHGFRDCIRRVPRDPAAGPDTGEHHARGAGYAYNQAIRQSVGEFLCFFDADDVSCPDRVEKQLALARDPTRHHSIRSVNEALAFPTAASIAQDTGEVIVGCGFVRDPPDATPRYTAWLNRVDGRALVTQRFRECTLAKPTWFMSRGAYNHVPGGFDEGGRGTPEDLIFLYAHLQHGGSLARVDEALMTYRYHNRTHTHLVDWRVLWRLRTGALQDQVLSQATSVTLWGGKEANRLYRSLDEANKAKVQAFCDVAETKLKSGGLYDSERKVHIPIVHYSAAKPLVITCVKLDLHPGFEDNLASLGLEEGAPDGYVMFS